MAKTINQGKSSTRNISHNNDNGVFSGIETFLSKNSNPFFYVIYAISILFTILQFDVKISVGHDDALYIKAAYDIIHKFPDYYYTLNAPMYPLVMTIPVAIFGINIIPLKLVSMLFMFIFLWIFYKAFQNVVPRIILFPVLLFIGTNPFFIYYASMTYTEALFLMLQATFFYYIFKFESADIDHENIKQTWKNWLVIGLMTFLLAFSRTIAYSALPAVILYYVIFKRYKSAMFTAGGFTLFYVLFALIKRIIWATAANNVSGQMSILLQKNPYDPSEGMDDISGFIGRFIDNTGLYMHKRFFQVLGFIPENYIEVSIGIGVIVWALFLFGIYRAFRDKKKLLFFAMLHALAIISASFLMLQARWDQIRIIMIHAPIILFSIYYGFYSLIERRSKSFSAAFMLSLFILIILFSGLTATLKNTSKNFAVLRKNIKGDLYYGYTPDWINFLKISEWSAKNLPKKAVIASRKAPMSFIYGKGREFYPIYTVATTDADSILMNFKKAGVTHVIMGNLRKNPFYNTGEVVNTIQRMLQPISVKYPDKLHMVHQEGISEEAYLFEIKY